MKRSTIICFFSLLLMVSSVCGSGGGYIVGNTAEWETNPDEEYVKHLTHLNLCFIYPKGLEGEIRTGFRDENIKKIVAMGHRHGVKMGIAFGGGGVYIDSTLMKDTTIRARLVSNIMDFVDTYDFDGVDNDWEPIWDSDEAVKFKKNQDMKAYYGIFTKLLRDSLDARFGEGVKSLSASIMNKNMIWYDDPDLMKKSNHFPLGFWEHLDFVSLMNYDDGIGGGHGTYEAVFGSNGSIAHWMDQGIPKEKMCVGLPFYGRGAFSANNWAAMKYHAIVDSFPELSLDVDVVKCDVGGGEMNYGFNSVATVKRKQKSADSLGLKGVMICFINYDKPIGHTHSLLGALRDIAAPVIASLVEKGSMEFSLEKQKVISVQPIQRVSLLTPSGRRVWSQTYGGSVTSVALPSVAKGVYIVEVVVSSGLYREIYSSR